MSKTRRRTGLYHQKYDRLLLILLCGRLQESLTRCFVLSQILMLEYTHANGITILTINKELMHQFTFNRKAKPFAVNVNRFFIPLYQRSDTAYRD